MNEANILRKSLPVFLSEGAFLRHPEGLCELGWQFGNTLKSQPKDAISWLSMDFFDPSPSYQVPVHNLKISHVEVIEILKEFLALEPEPALPRAVRAPRQEDFDQDLQQILAKIKLGEIEKAVPIVEQTWDYCPDFKMVAHLILNALQAPANLYPYGRWGKSGGFIGATPEVLFESKGGWRIETMALAGTLAKQDHQGGEALLQDPKERQEHQKVIQDITQQLHGFGDLQISETKLEELPKLFHLKTKITLFAQAELLVSDLIGRLHPTAALGIFPRPKDRNWYLELSNQKSRATFGAPFGLVDKNGDALVLVGIRNITWTQKNTFLRAGCGIVAGSSLQKEWTELSKKRESTLSQLGLQ